MAVLLGVVLGCMMSEPLDHRRGFGTGLIEKPFICGIRLVLKSRSRVRMQLCRMSSTNLILFRVVSLGPMISTKSVAQTTLLFFLIASCA